MRINMIGIIERIVSVRLLLSFLLNGKIVLQPWIDALTRADFLLYLLYIFLAFYQLTLHCGFISFKSHIAVEHVLIRLFDEVWTVFLITSSWFLTWWCDISEHLPIWLIIVANQFIGCSHLFDLPRVVVVWCLIEGFLAHTKFICISLLAITWQIIRSELGWACLARHHLNWLTHCLVCIWVGRSCMALLRHPECRVRWG